MSQIMQTTVGPIEIIYEDDNVLVINKPAGISMHKINADDKSVTIHDLFGSKLSDNDELRGGIVHRLDKDTSGVVILAKTGAALEFLQSQFKKRQVDKSYLALVWGRLRHPRARIELPIVRSRKSPTAMSIKPGGRLSVSEYEVISEYDNYSYIKVSIHTGRTHQIRVQFAHMGHPVVGDKMYGSRSMPAGLARQFLHAQKLALILPAHKAKTEFEADLPADLDDFLGSLHG